MNNFLKLTTRIINTKQISEIVIHPNSYSIYYSHIINNGFLLLSVGWINSNTNYIIIDLEKNKEDYDIVTNWINNIK